MSGTTFAASAKPPENSARRMNSPSSRKAKWRPSAQRATARKRPRVACIEWLDPVYVGGHWVPEMVEAAGGVDILGRAGEPSFCVSSEQVIAAAPDVIIVMPCGFNVNRTAKELERTPLPASWNQLPAVRDGRVLHRRRQQLLLALRPAPGRGRSNPCQLASSGNSLRRSAGRFVLRDGPRNRWIICGQKCHAVEPNFPRHLRASQSGSNSGKKPAPKESSSSPIVDRSGRSIHRFTVKAVAPTKNNPGTTG